MLYFKTNSRDFVALCDKDYIVFEKQTRKSIYLRKKKKWSMG